jgi:hypothetical protein
MSDPNILSALSGWTVARFSVDKSPKDLTYRLRAQKVSRLSPERHHTNIFFHSHQSDCGFLVSSHKSMGNF